jgi:hypothetical protein
MHYRDFARSFDSDLDIKQMLVRLNEAGPWSWKERDSERWGLYLYTGVLPQQAKGIVKIFLEQDAATGMWGQPPAKEPRFVVQVNLASDASNAHAMFEEIQQTLFERVLPAVGARDLQEAETE